MNKKLIVIGATLIILLNLTLPVLAVEKNEATINKIENENLNDEENTKIVKSKEDANEEKINEKVQLNVPGKMMSKALRSAASTDTEMTGRESLAKTYVNRDGKNYVYTRVNYANSMEIDRYCFETNENIIVFRESKGYEVYDAMGYYVQDKVIYTSFYETENSKVLRVVGFDTQTEKVSYDKTFPIIPEKQPMEFIMDYKQNFYFKICDADADKYWVASFNKDGKAIDTIQIDMKAKGYNLINLITTNKDSTVLFIEMHVQAGISSWWDDYVIKINNGKFVNKETYLIREKGGMNLHFLDNNGKYAYDQYGEIIEFNYSDNTAPSGVSFKIKKAISYNGSYIYTSGLCSSDDKYLYLSSNNGMLYVVNWKTYKIERSLNLGEDKIICGVHKNGDNLIVEHHDNNSNPFAVKYYFRTINLTELNSAKQNVKITTHTAMKHTQDQIKKKYKDSTIINKTSDLYQEKPVVNSPYKAGTLKVQTKTDTLNQINYFRWLAGLSNVSIYEPYMKYARTRSSTYGVRRKI